MDNQTLELQIKSTSQQAVATVDKLVKSLTNTENVLTNIYLELGNIEKKSGQSIPKATKEVNNLKNSSDKATSSANKLGKALSLSGAYLSVKRFVKSTLGWFQETIDKTEQLNLFNVVFKNIEKDGVKTFSTLGKEAIRFQNKLNEAFGTNQTETLKYQALFRSMGDNQGIPEQYSALMSETMTKFTYDLSSLYNKGEKETAEALRAGVYAAQTKPVRSFGLDITQTSMQPILDSLGIDRQVKELSQAEKMILRYIAVLRQGQVAMGDFANTVESPANQMKVFKQQLVETKVAFTSLFIGTFANALPYANALLMIIKEVSKAIADMLGIKLSDYNSSIASQEDAYIDLEDSVDGATDAVKELKKQTFGFDEIHNINENKDNGSGDLTGGIDQRLLDAIKGYDNGMEKVRMKATEIRDRIMEWLGFTKDVDPLTGEIGFKYQGMETTLKNMWDSFTGLSTQGKILVGLGLVAGATKLWSTGKKLVTVFGNTGLGKVIKSLYKPTTSLFSNMLSGLKGSHSSLKSGIQSWREQMGIIDSTTGKVDGFKGVLNGAKTAMSGLVTGGLGLYSVYESMKSISDEGFNLANALGLVGGSLSAIAGGVQIGAIFGPWGAVIGGATGAIATLITAISGYETETDKMISKMKQEKETMLDYVSAIEESNKKIENTLTTNLVETTYHENLLSELEQICDSNGKVKQGYEERAQFILNELSQAYGQEFSLIDGVISKNGEQVGSYAEVRESIGKVIKAKQAEILLNANEEKYADALERNLTNYMNKEKSLKALKEAQDKLNEKAKEYEQILNDTDNILELNVKTDKWQREYADLEKIVKDAEEIYNGYANQYKEDSELISQYEDLKTAILTENWSKVEEGLIKYTNTYKVENDEQVKNVKATMDQLLGYYKEQGDTELELRRKNGEKITEQLEKQAYSEYITIKNALVKQSQTVEEMSDEIINSWGWLAENSANSFLEEFGKIPKNVQEQVVDKMYEKGYKISDELQKGIEQISPEIHIKSRIDKATLQLDADFSQATTKANNWLNSTIDKIKSAISNITGNSKKENGGAFYNGSWHDIKQYANGGAPSHGSLFWAGEHGAEVVAHANGRTEVLNQSQMASVMYSAIVSGMAQVMSQYGGGVAEINVHASKDVIVETAINGINQTTKQTGSCPINIPLN